jgi:hypothetical protein
MFQCSWGLMKCFCTAMHLRNGRQLVTFFSLFLETFSLCFRMSPYEPVREERRKEQGLQEDQLSGGSTGYSCVQADQKNMEIEAKFLLFKNGTKDHVGFSAVFDLE